MEREFTPNRKLESNVEHDSKTTLGELLRLLQASPDIFGDRLQDIQRSVEDAQSEIDERGELSQGTAEELDDLYRPFKPESLK